MTTETKMRVIGCWVIGVAVACIVILMPPEARPAMLAVLSLGVSGGYALGAAAIVASRERQTDDDT